MLDEFDESWPEFAFVIFLFLHIFRLVVCFSFYFHYQYTGLSMPSPGHVILALHVVD